MTANHPRPLLGLLAVVSSLAFPSVVGAQAVVATREIAPPPGRAQNTYRLSDSMRIILRLEGPTPLRVELPTELEKMLAPEVRAMWRIRAAGPEERTLLPEGRERWGRPFRLDPYAAGDPVPLVFAPVKVTAGTDSAPQDVTWPSVDDLRVLAPVDEPRPENARPVTKIEELPPLPVPQPEEVGVPFIAALAGVFVVVLVLGVVRRWRAKPPLLPPGEWAVVELLRARSELRAGRTGPGEVPERVAAILRAFVERQHGLPAPKLTTTELAAGCEQAGWPTDRIGSLRELLGTCDRAKFAGEAPSQDELAVLLFKAWEWVLAAGPVDQTQNGPKRTQRG